LIYNEARRQYALLKIKEELHQRGIKENNFQAGSAKVTQLLLNSSWDPIRRALKRGEEIYCVNLKGYAGLLRYPTQSGKVFSGEISDRVRVVACLTRLPNILTSDSTEETIDSVIWKRIRKVVKASVEDAQVLVWGNQEDVETGVEEIIIRAREATQGIPSETRQAMADGTNGFERILPGADRMYPDTDLPPLEIVQQRLENLEKNVPEALWEREKKYRQLGIPEHLLIPVASSPKAELFETIINEFKAPPLWAVRFLFETIKALARKGLAVEKMDDKNWKTFFSYAQKNPALLERGNELIETFLRKHQSDLKDELAKFIKRKIDHKKFNNTVEKIINSVKPDVSEKEKEHKFYMGLVMDKYRGYIRGEEVSKAVWNLLR
jgi:glutamyl-tRNA(Gln) amidotransferase subunit E